ncbi:MAG: LptF/LptG family permease [Alphaproteobacteria bacterium]|nr:LptF/LptG family permease [Alphaproteobacteria bacterium]
MKTRSVHGLGFLLRTSRYVLANSFGAMRNTFVYVVLLLEAVRLKLVWNVAIHQPNPLSAIARYLGQWLPLYSGLSLQVALAVGAMLGLSKISRSRELDAMQALGFSMMQLLAPIFALTFLVSAACVVIWGWLQPISLYDSSLFIHEVQATSSLVSDGKNMFRVEGNKTILVDDIARDGRLFSKVFMFETYPDGRSVTTAGSAGQLIGSGPLSEQSYIVKGLDVMEVKGDGSTPLAKGGATTTASRLANVQGPIKAIEEKAYGARGHSEYEWTLPELLSGGKDLPFTVAPNRISAELNYRLAQLAFLWLLPFIAVATIIEPRRNPGPFRFFIGLFVVLGFNQYLSIGTNFSRNSSWPPSLTLWVPFAILTVAVLWRFWRVSYRPAFKSAR